MRNVCSLLFVLLVAACSVPPKFYPYDGTKTIKSEGGFLDGYVSSESLSFSVFEKKQEYKYDINYIYSSGLPQGKTCYLLWHISGSTHQDIEKIAFELGGNVLSRSDVSFPTQFEEGGILQVGMGAGIDQLTSWTGWGAHTSIIYRYNIFECK